MIDSQRRLLNHDPTKCPSCGSVIGPQTFFVDLNANTIIVRDLSWRVSPKLAEFTSALYEAWPSPLTDGALRVRLWGGDAYDRHPSALAIYAHHLNMMLKPLGGACRRVPDRGYKLTLPQYREPA